MERTEVEEGKFHTFFILLLRKHITIEVNIKSILFLLLVIISRVTAAVFTH